MRGCFRIALEFQVHDGRLGIHAADDGHDERLKRHGGENPSFQVGCLADLRLEGGAIGFGRGDFRLQGGDPLFDGVPLLGGHAHIPKSEGADDDEEGKRTIKEDRNHAEDHGQSRHDVLAVRLQVVDLIGNNLHGQLR